ncbi:predicted protein [Nematostella vectensis]|uniref:Uncharacterized protein n=1 Tax=Nematostella vectensis TaxID=45351 RepID=A7TAV4_NEMVE|nr:predicted protein [Nematostella vectensis]|eukprot:XP_001618963.1 hypothetical protein NEMVEDRAFT_v1g224652 [Nematostella vectensis]
MSYHISFQRAVGLVKWPNLEYPDVYEYLIETPGPYTRESMKCRKGLEAYNQFQSGWVQKVLSLNTTADTRVLIAKVLYSQRLSEDALRPWVAIKKDGTVMCAHCNCMAGRVHISESDINVLKNECEQYYNCQALFLANVKPTTWTIGKAIPYYTDEIYNDLGFGLGLNSMQGREAKHIKLSSYAKNTTKGKHLRWWQVFKHEFMELIWLKETDSKQVAKKLHCTNHSENDAQDKPSKDKYIPPYSISNNEFCACGQPKSVPVASCSICSSDEFKLVVKSCKEAILSYLEIIYNHSSNAHYQKSGTIWRLFLRRMSEMPFKNGRLFSKIVCNEI